MDEVNVDDGETSEAKKERMNSFACNTLKREKRREKAAVECTQNRKLKIYILFGTVKCIKIESAHEQKIEKNKPEI